MALTTQSKTNWRQESRPLISLALVVAICWFCIYFLLVSLQYSFMQSDARGYASEAQALIDASYNLNSIYKFERAHVPGYSIMIALLHPVLPSLEIIQLMQIISFAAVLLSTITVYFIFKSLNTSQAWQGSILYSLFPLVGLTYSVYPIADSLASLCITGALLFYIQDRKIPLAICLGFGPFIHNATWPILGLVLLIGFWQRRLKWWMVIPFSLPLLLYWFFGYTYTGDLLWIIRKYMERSATHRTALPIFDGMLAPLIVGGSLVDWTKALFMTALFAFALWLLVSRSWKAQPVFLAVILPILVWGVIAPEFIIFSAVRFAKFLVIPFWVYSQSYSFAQEKLFSRYAWGVAAILCFASQIGWSFYMYRY